MKIPISLSLLLLMAACSGGAGPDTRAGAPTDPPKSGPPSAEVKRACEAEAYRRLQQIPAVASGKTSYDTGGARQQFYAECLARKGYR